ncbi:TetR/AcrR family transcriptional regulator [Corynebacterium mendelii]|uniref:TetR/AcrR family transcriptional regulator n=1 Tax=Corynebacterium mendelii TaxID=2765362 RepID=A0A939DZ68_9CORY|nr:TetR/AcrR family transcriptional regulator [Corynebacterium mendelii]MBN9643738.1 TetR/AcrR family transcriptional regulator [Corynebacterium mendelii]
MEQSYPAHSRSLGRPQRVGRKTGPKPTFTRADVIFAALDIGIGKFTLSEVAGKIGVATSAVYRLFDSRDDLVRACLEHCAKSVDWDVSPSMKWQAALKQLADRIWNVCEAYPGLDILLFTLPGAYMPVKKFINRFITLLMREGFTKQQALLAFDFISDTVISAHIGITAMNTPDASGVSGLERTNQQLEETDYYRPDETYMSRGFLDEKLDLIIEGLARRLEDTAANTPDD